MSSGIRWAETTCASYATPNSASTSAAADITDQSESLPMITPTSGASATVVSQREAVGGRTGPGTDLGEIGAERSDVPDLASRTESLAVQVHLDVRPVGEPVMRPLVDAVRGDVVRPAQQVRHHDHRGGERGGAERVVVPRAQVLLELRRARTLDRPVC